MWSDPEDVDTWAISPRGAGWLFGAKVTNEVSELQAISMKNLYDSSYPSVLQVVCIVQYIKGI